jgi:hypothetical protein
MGGASVESKWEIGGDITFTGEMLNFNKTYHGRGAVLGGRMSIKQFLQLSERIPFPSSLLIIRPSFSHSSNVKL